MYVYYINMYIQHLNLNGIFTADRLSGMAVQYLVLLLLLLLGAGPARCEPAHTGRAPPRYCDAVDAEGLTAASLWLRIRGGSGSGAGERPILIRGALHLPLLSGRRILDALDRRRRSIGGGPGVSYRHLIEGGTRVPSTYGSVEGDEPPYVFEELDEHGMVGGYKPFAALAAVDPLGFRRLREWFHEWWGDYEPGRDGSPAPKNPFFMLGRHNSGLSFHTHAAAFNALCLGTKRWVLVDPASPIFPNLFQPKSQWLERVMPALPLETRPLECLQRAGDVLYVPENWGHAVWNDPDRDGKIAVAVSALTTVALQEL